MEINKKSRLKILLIGIAIGISTGVLVGFITGTFNLPMAVIIPAVVVPITFVAILYFKKGQDK